MAALDPFTATTRFELTFLRKCYTILPDFADDVQLLKNLEVYITVHLADKNPTVRRRDVGDVAEAQGALDVVGFLSFLPHDIGG